MWQRRLNRSNIFTQGAKDLVLHAVLKILFNVAKKLYTICLVYILYSLSEQNCISTFKS